MDFKELNDDRKIISSSMKFNRYIDNGFSTQAKSIVNTHSILGAIAFALPLFGLDNIIYAGVLWHMYFSLCSLAKKSFNDNRAKSFIGAVIVNFIIASVIELILSFIPGVGIIGAAVTGFFSIKISGAAYLKTLEYLHNGNVAEKYNFGSTTSAIPPVPNSNYVPPIPKQ